MESKVSFETLRLSTFTSFVVTYYLLIFLESELSMLTGKWSIRPVVSSELLDFTLNGKATGSIPMFLLPFAANFVDVEEEVVVDEVVDPVDEALDVEQSVHQSVATVLRTEVDVPKFGGSMGGMGLNRVSPLINEAANDEITQIDIEPQDQQEMKHNEM
ncbi:uncharacterized protein MELLADRAFT_64198 [Melampsora larici-populina 98AG31]|uniref:Uncharacterized protein n=1 Tax=Melampsora larici-populina (strain 98AG31 / pathotype 3-4-7) TaxID=747676 RepID=F4RQC6_MELLP|nr:uncharacterized protein MELLADRAFT_64198 [Melampsora larici-populina 98AG31]EGG05430.1 hypothetical protein MELLADRAFT_64198 [Melampsora larici-populina 98AG31]